MSDLAMKVLKWQSTGDVGISSATLASIACGLKKNCSGQQKLATALEFFQYRFSDSFGGNPPLYSCGLSAL